MVTFLTYVTTRLCVEFLSQEGKLQYSEHVLICEKARSAMKNHFYEQAWSQKELSLKWLLFLLEQTDCSWLTAHAKRIFIQCKNDIQQISSKSNTLIFTDIRQHCSACLVDVKCTNGEATPVCLSTQLSSKSKWYSNNTFWFKSNVLRASLKCLKHI